MVFCSPAAQELFSPGYLRKTELPQDQCVALINPLSVVSHLLTAPQSGYLAQCLKFIGQSFVVSRLQITPTLLLEFDSRNKDTSRNKDSFLCLSIFYNRRPLHMFGGVRPDACIGLMLMWSTCCISDMALLKSNVLNEVRVILIPPWGVLFRCHLKGQIDGNSIRSENRTS